MRQDRGGSAPRRVTGGKEISERSACTQRGRYSAVQVAPIWRWAKSFLISGSHSTVETIGAVIEAVAAADEMLYLAMAGDGVFGVDQVPVGKG